VTAPSGGPGRDRDKPGACSYARVTATVGMRVLSWQGKRRWVRLHENEAISMKSPSLTHVACASLGDDMRVMADAQRADAKR
jgi:hypothetical protein